MAGMSGLEQLKITFFEECNELLQSLEGGLADIREGKRQKWPG